MVAKSLENKALPSERPSPMADFWTTGTEDQLRDQRRQLFDMIDRPLYSRDRWRIAYAIAGGIVFVVAAGHALEFGRGVISTIAMMAGAPGPLLALMEMRRRAEIRRRIELIDAKLEGPRSSAIS
jgi:hypothetical protein